MNKIKVSRKSMRRIKTKEHGARGIKISSEKFDRAKEFGVNFPLEKIKGSIYFS